MTPIEMSVSKEQQWWFLTHQPVLMTTPHPCAFFPPKSKQIYLRRGLVARRWPKTVFIGVCRIGGERVVVRVAVRVEDLQTQQALQIEAYDGTRSRVNSVAFPVAFLPYASIGSHQQRNRVAEVCTILISLHFCYTNQCVLANSATG